MKHLIIIILFLLLSNIQFFSQVEIPFFEKMEGTWERTYDTDSIKGIKETSYSFWMFDHNFFEIQTWNFHDTSRSFKELYVFTLNDEKEVIGWSMDKNGYNHMKKFKGDVNGNKMTIEGRNEYEQCRIAYELKDRSLTRIVRSKTRDGKEIYSEVLFNVYVPENIKAYYPPAKYEMISEPGLAYVCHISNYFVSVINTRENEVIGKINCSKGSVDICFSPDNRFGYIANFGSNNITVFNKKTNDIITTVQVGQNPSNLLPVQNGNYILVSHESQDGIWVLDASKNTIVRKLEEGTGLLYLIENENKIYQPQIFTPFLFVIDPNTFEIIRKVETGGRPMSMAFIKDKRYAYLANLDFNEITKIDTRNDSVVNHILNVNYPRGIASTKNGKFIYATDVIESKVFVIDTDTDSIISVIDGFAGPTSVDITADDKYAYVTNQGVGDVKNPLTVSTVTVIEISTNKIIKSIKVSDNPINIIIDK